MNAFELDRAGRRPTVVLLHSSGSSSRQWTALVGLLQPRFDVHALDLYGHGTRPAWTEPRPLTLDDEAVLVEPILREAGRVHLVGHSYGGAVAMKVAERNPAAVASLIAYEPVLFGWLFEDDAASPPALEVRNVADAMRKALHARNLSGAARAFIDYWSGEGTWDSIPAVRQQGVASRMPTVLQQFSALVEGAPRATRLRWLQSMTFLGGAHTATSTRRIGELLRAWLPHASHQTLPGVGHMGPVSHTETVNCRIVAALRRYVGVAPNRPLAIRAA